MAAAFNRRSLTAESWEHLFDFLDPMRPGKHGDARNADAETRFQEMARKLTYFFASRGCREAEDLSAETILRVAAKCADLSAVDRADRPRYFFGVARNVLHEWQRRDRREWIHRETAAQDPTLVPAVDPARANSEDEQHRCLERCMSTLTAGARRLILSYYGEGKSAKIVRHRELAGELGKSINALRIEVHRIRTTLRRCVADCMHSAAATAGI